MITKYIFRVYCLAAIILLSFEISAQNVDETYSSQLQELYDIKEDIRKKSSIILHIAKNTNEASFNDQYTSREYVLISSANCQVYESQFDTEYPIFSPNINDELLILSEDDNWFEIKLKDGRNAWIEESCGQKTIRSEKKKVGRLKSINNKNDQIQLASFVMEEIKILSIEAEKKSKKIRENKRSTPQDLEQLSSLNGQINKFKSLTESAYIQYLVPELDAVNYLNLLDKFSFLGELQLGASDFSMVFGENSKISQKGLIGDFLVDLKYKLNNQSQANFILSNSNDIIQTPFTNTMVEAGYKSAYKKLRFNSAISLNKYNDKFNAFNQYNRIGFKLGANQKIGNKSTINFNYLLNANNYALFEGINFSNHSINLSTISVLSASKSLNVNLRTNIQAGEEERRNFILFFPELKYNIRKQNATNQYFFSYQKYSFNNLELRDTDRLMLGIRNSKRGTSKSSNRYLGLSAKLFQNKPTFNYYQLDSRFSSNWTKNKSFFTSSAFRINYYPLQNNLNYTDLQFSLGSNGSLFYNFSSFNR